MALDRYDSSARITDATSFDLASSKQALSSSQSLEGRLDKLSSYLYKGLEKKAEAEGLQYGVTNRPTLEQLQVALDKGTDPSTLFVEGGTVFGEAAREAQAELYRQDLEYDAANYFSTISSAIEAGAPIEDPFAIAQDMQAKIDGYSNILKDISPTQNIKFRAAASALGNKVFNKINDTYTTRITGENQAKIEKSIQNYGDDYFHMLIETEGNAVEVEKLMIINEQGIRNLIDRVPKKVTDNYNALQSATELAYKRSILHYIDNTQAEFVPKGSDVLTQLRNGNAGKFSNVYSLLSPDNKIKLEKEVLDSLVAKNNINSENEKVMERENQDKKISILTQRGDGSITGLEAISRIRKLGIPVSDALVSNLMKPTEETDMTVKEQSDLKVKLALGQATRADILASAENGSITWKGYSALSSEYVNITTNVASGLKSIRLALNINENTQFALIPTLSRELYSKLASELIRQGQQALALNKEFNQETVAQELIKENKVQERASSIEDALATLSGINAGITATNWNLYDTKEELEALGFDRNQRDDILRQTRILSRTLGN